MNTETGKPCAHKSTELSSQNDGELQDAIELLAMHELTPSERSRLLHKIAANPQLWKILALEFVQNQVLQEAIQEQQDDSQLDSISSDTLSAPVFEDRLSSRLPLKFLNLAACFLLCFGAGLWWGTKKSETTLQVATAESSVPTKGQTERNEAAENAPPESPGESALDSTGKPNELATEGANENLGRVAWVDRHGMRVMPVFTQSESAKAWTELNPPRLDGGLKRMFARSGWNVKADWGFMAGKLASGQDFVIPVAQPEYEYVGLRVH